MLTLVFTNGQIIGFSHLIMLLLYQYLGNPSIYVVVINNYKNICQPVSMNYHLSGILKESFSLSLERVSDLLIGSCCL